MNCFQCGNSVQPGDAFCDNCGAALGGAAASQPTVSDYPPQEATVAETGMVSCPNCGNQAVLGEIFCDNCGAALDQTSAQPSYEAEAQVAPPAPAAAPPPAEGMVACPQCHFLVEAGSAFCDNCGTALAGPPSAQPVTQVDQPVVQATTARLVVRGSGATLPFPRGAVEAIVGREDPVSNHFPEIDLTEHLGEEGGVSRKHARFVFQRGQWHLEDLNSVNGTWVNPRATRQRLPAGKLWPLKDGDEVRFGQVVLTFRT
jgi:hypothetical protein